MIKFTQEHVCCDKCGNWYKEAGYGMAQNRQGYQCSATVHEEGIYGHYGSTLIDMQYWLWVNGIPDGINLTDSEYVICDTCIKRLIDNGDIIKS